MHIVMPVSLACSASWAHTGSRFFQPALTYGRARVCVLIPGTRSAPDTPHALGPHPWDCCNLLERFSEPAGRSLAAKKQLPACEPGPRGEGQVRSAVCPGIPLCPLGCHMLVVHTTAHVLDSSRLLPSPPFVPWLGVMGNHCGGLF